MRRINNPNGVASLNRPIMSQSLSQVHVHLVFSTRNRVPFLRNNELRIEMHNYLGGVSNQHHCPIIRVGGAEDHVHLIAVLGREVSQANWVRDLKRASSAWVKGRFNEKGVDNFAWQTGYGCFAVGVDCLPKVVLYVETQMEHHKKTGFQDEYRTILTQLGMTWDERYVWD